MKCGRPRQCGMVTAVNSIRSPGTLRTNFQGPLPIGFLRNSSSPTRSIYPLGMMAPSGATARDSPAGRPICGLVVRTLTVNSSITSMLLIVRRMLAAADASEPGPIWRSRLNLTSCAVSLSPLWKVWPGRMKKVQVKPSGVISQRSATPSWHD